MTTVVTMPALDPSKPVPLFVSAGNAPVPEPGAEERARATERMRMHSQTIPVGDDFFSK